MIKWIRLTKNQYLGFFAFGLALLVLQELPYLVMPLLPPGPNPLMDMQDKSALLNAAEKVLGISCMMVMLFLVRGDGKWFSLATAKEKLFFGAAMLMLAVYYSG